MDWLKPQWNMMWFLILFVAVCWVATMIGSYNPPAGPECDNAQYSAQSC